MSASFAVHAACIRGVEALPVTVEVATAGGLPGMQVVGMADAAVLEARGRIRCALREAGFEVPRCSITVNLAPGDVRKTGAGFDLPIAVAVLAVTGQIPLNGLDKALLVGELSLKGEVSPVKGDVAFQLLARDRHLTLVGAWDAGPVVAQDVAQGYLSRLDDLRAGISHLPSRPHEGGFAKPEMERLDFADVVGQEMAKRGLAIAATGDHGLLMVGAPGSGKTMLAKRFTTILPPLDEKRKQEALCIHSVVGGDLSRLLTGERPFRAPHHSITSAGLLGGGKPVRPGEVSLAHGGVLFLDEFAEFSTHVLQMLRQPMEEGAVRLVRAEGLFRFPARFQLIAASNPCPCGYLGDPERPCTCSDRAIEQYRAHLTGPLMDRIDIVMDVARPSPEALVAGRAGASSKELRTEVDEGRAFRAWRRGRTDDVAERATDPSSFGLTREALDLLVQISHATVLSARRIAGLCRVARTIADMDRSEDVETGHVLEASAFQGVR